MDAKKMKIIFIVFFAASLIIQTVTMIMVITLKMPESQGPQKPSDNLSSEQVRKTPVFMYHTSSEEDPGAGDYTYLYVKPSEFEKQIAYLKKNGYTLCTFDDWDNLSDIEKPVFLTFDDGYAANYTEIFPILKKYNAKITIFLVADLEKKDITWDMVREMSNSGLVKFESHTLSHPKLDQISSDDEKLTAELRDSKLKIEQETGKTVRAIAYPHGIFDDAVKSKAAEYYKFGLRSYGGMNWTYIDNYEILRFPAERDMTIEEFAEMLASE